MFAHNWLIYIVLCAAFFVFPTNSSFTVARISSARRPLNTLITISAATLGLTAAVTISSIALGILALLPSALFSMTSSAVLVGVILLTLWLVVTPPVKDSLADNDNLPNQSSAALFAYTFQLTVTSKRTILFFFGLLPQILNQADCNITALPIIQAVTFATALVCLTMTSIFSVSYLGWTRHLSFRKKPRLTPHRQIIARRSVSARYRKMAA